MENRVDGSDIRNLQPDPPLEWFRAQKTITGWDLGKRPFLEPPGEDSDVFHRLLRASDTSSLERALDAARAQAGEDRDKYLELENRILYGSQTFAVFEENHAAHMRRMRHLQHEQSSQMLVSITQTMEFFLLYNQLWQLDECFKTYHRFAVGEFESQPQAVAEFHALAAAGYNRAKRPDFSLAIVNDYLRRIGNGKAPQSREIRHVTNSAAALGGSLDHLPRRVEQLNSFGCQLLPVEGVRDIVITLEAGPVAPDAPRPSLPDRVINATLRGRSRKIVVRAIEKVPGLKPFIIRILYG